MLIVRVILALIALGMVATRPRSWASAAGAAACALVAVATGAASPAEARAAMVDASPPVAFLASVMGLALLADGSGLAARLARRLAEAGGGRTAVLFGCVCAVCAALTAALSLDGAVVVMLPVVTALAREHGAPLRPLLLATVGVANSFSAALPAGNPTNLVVMERLGMSSSRFVERMLVPSVAATVACVAILAVIERSSLRCEYTRAPGQCGAPACSGSATSLAVGALAAAAAADWLSPVFGISPWLPVSAVAVVALSLARRTPLLALPLRTGLQIVSLLVVLGALAAGVSLGGLRLAAPSLVGLAAVVSAVSICAALANNLPASAAVSSLLTAGPGSYAALLGLSAGALATPHGSVATLVSFDMAGCRTTRGLAGALALAALGAVLAGTALLWLTGA